MNQNDSTVIYRREGAIAYITLDRPEVLNAINADLARDFLATCREVSTDKEIRVVVINAAGRAFAAGGDLAQFRQDPLSVPEVLIDPMHEAILLLSRLQAPVIASLHGAVSGAGMSLALACDLAIAADNTRFNLAYAKVGASCDLGASWNLPRLVGMRRALEIALLSDTLDADEALRLGLVNFVVAPDALVDQTLQLATRLAESPSVALGILKRLIRSSFNADLAEQLGAERAGFARCSETEDFREGVAAFLDRRPAVYKGC
jgi:2-(1,2-epoxy-1,2-dihydrophenyl)acetyl-CoA isomerase